MNENLQQPEPRADVIASLRALAARGASVRELVAAVVTPLGLRGDEVIPILWYFKNAFDLPLTTVLPLREWLGTDEDQKIDALLLPAIRRTQDRWEASIEERDGNTCATAIDATVTTAPNRS